MVLLNLLFNLYEYDYLPMRSVLTARFAGNWLRRWREVLLYIRMAAAWIVKGRPSEAEYIARGGLGRRNQIGFSNHTPASDR